LRSLDPARDDAGVRLRTLRLRRGMSQVALAELACVSPAFVSMVETGQRSLRSADHILAMADVLKVSPFYLADGRDDPATPVRLTPGMVPFPARSDPSAMARHEQFARQFLLLARCDGRAAGDWLRRLAREPTVNPWLLVDQLATILPRPGPPRSHL
jgi:transcriptional regulator with XRE-family HTH domain